MEEKCSKCSTKMVQKGKMHSGNSVYQLFLCNECGTEKMRAIGVNK